MRTDKEGRIYCMECGYAIFYLFKKESEIKIVCQRCLEELKTDSAEPE